jgi:hypothetical protein
VAAGSGFAADAMDVSGNNIAIGGATYVGTATTVATATSVNGLAQGTIPVTATPNLANGTGGTATSTTTTSGPDDKPAANNPGAPPAPACGHGHDDAPAPAPAPASVEIHMLTPMQAFHQHFDHMWG